MATGSSILPDWYLTTITMPWSEQKVIAIGVSIDNPGIDPALHICVLNEERIELFRMPVYSKQSIANAGHSTTLHSRRPEEIL
jgi:hypothetical protein